MTHNAPLSPAEVVDASRAARPALLQLIGNTPLVPLDKLNPNPRVRLYAKLECFNPGGSVKDRIALAMIEDAEQRGELTDSKTILEATSGNTGIGLAMVAAVKGYRIHLVMSEGVSLERRKILSALGAELQLTPAELGTDGAIEVAYELAGSEGNRFFLTDQYNNPANLMAHYHGTAEEIWRQTAGAVTHFVATLGTTGTVMGNARRLKEHNPEIKVIAIEPYLGHRLQGLKNMKEAYVPGIFDRRTFDETINVDDESAHQMSRRLAKEEGLLVGMSSGAAMHVAVEQARQLDEGTMVVMLPDGGERYLSTPLFQVVSDLQHETKLHFLNTLTRRMEVFTPIDPKQVTMYTCGPTVHAAPHLGLYRRVLVADLVRRTVELAGYPVRQVMNITDVDDRTLEAAEQAGRPLSELTEELSDQFMEDLATLGVKPATDYPKASAYAEQMIGMTSKLVQGGHAYEQLKSVYFNVGQAEGYGRLSGVDLEKIQIGATVDLDSYEKHDPRDFTLLKRATLGEIKRGVASKSTWGNVRPGWHIQCATMARALLGDQADIHVGGIDLVFPHHENEIAICRAVTGKRPANYWLHSGLAMVDGRKMSRSNDNAVFLRDLLTRGYQGRHVRLLLLSKHYRQPLNCTEAALAACKVSLQRLDKCVLNLRAVRGGESHKDVALLAGKFEAAFRDALFDDLNISAALAALFQLVRQINGRIGQGELAEADAELVLAALDRADSVLGVLLPEGQAVDTPEIDELVRQREDARQAGDFAAADRLRDELGAKGAAVQDTPKGPRVRRITASADG